MNDGPHFNYGGESQSTGLAGVRRSARVFCDPPFALSRYRREDRKDAGNTFGLTGMWPRSLWATNHIPSSQAAFSQLGVKVSLHPAQALRTPLWRRRGFETERC